MKKIIFTIILGLIIQFLPAKSFAVTYRQLNRYVFASYTPANYSGKVMYIFEDPLCPYCYKLNKHIIKYSQESGYRINLVFKIVHGQKSINYAVKFVCSNRTLNNISFVKYTVLDFLGDNCQYGKNLVSIDDRLSDLLGVTITPTLISNTGFRETGLSLKAIKRGMGIR